MPYTTNKDVHIYYEETGKGPPLILQHGRTVNLEVWRIMGFTEPLAEKYRLVMIDARGHGRSDKPHTPEKYTMRNMVGDVTAVLDDLGIERAAYMGYSMGGQIGLAAGKYAPDRFNVFVIGGYGLSETDSKEAIDRAQNSMKEYRERAALIRRYREEGWPDDVEDWRRRFWSTTDYDAMIALCLSKENLGMVDYLPKLTTPYLFYAGTEDVYHHSRAKACAEIMQNAEFISFEGLSHAEGHYKSSVVLPPIMKFLDRVTTR